MKDEDLLEKYIPNGETDVPGTGIDSYAVENNVECPELPFRISVSDDFTLIQTESISQALPSRDQLAEVPREPAAENRPEKAATTSSNQVTAELSADDLDDDEDYEDLPVAESAAESYQDFLADDPLAPAYDLEHGNLMHHHDSLGFERLPKRADIRSAKEFFNSEILYRYDILEIEIRKQLQGSVRIELKGYQGGVWTVHLGEDISVVNRKEDAEIVLIMQQKEFLQMVNGYLNAQLAILSQKLRIIGDVRKAIQFQVLLVPQVD